MPSSDPTDVRECIESLELPRALRRIARSAEDRRAEEPALRDDVLSVASSMDFARRLAPPPPLLERSDLELAGRWGLSSLSNEDDVPARFDMD